jgi:hypothetical protein
MKKISVALFVCIFLAVTVSSALAVESFYGPTELIQYDASKAYNGYTLFTPFRQKAGEFWTYLIDMEGFVVHSFVHPNNPGLHAMLLENGNFLRGYNPPDAAAADTYGVMRAGGAAGGLQELDWNGNVLVDLPWYSENYRQHHDFHKIWNNQLGEYTYIMVAWFRKDYTDAANLGAAEANRAGYEDGWSPDGVVELRADGTLVWAWTFADHQMTTNPDGDAAVAPWLDATGLYTNTPAAIGNPEDYPEKLDINFDTAAHGSGGSPNPRPDMNHVNSLDYNQALDQITLNARQHDEFYVIDHGATFVSTTDWAANIAAAAGPAGDFIYRWGNPETYNQHIEYAGYRTRGQHQMWASHDIQWINDYAWEPDASGQGLWPDPPASAALPGAGNFLIFDNNTNNPTARRSGALEINGYLDDTLTDTGDYVNPPDAGYAGSGYSNQLVWAYRDLEGTFYSSYISGSQRLPNGNTVNMSGATGHMFEVTEDGEVVWEYINPIFVDAFTFQTNETERSFPVFRCHRYGPDFPGLAGKNLTPRSTLTGRMPLSGGAEDYDTVPSYTGFGFSGLGIGGGGAAGGGAGGGAGGY